MLRQLRVGSVCEFPTNRTLSVECRWLETFYFQSTLCFAGELNPMWKLVALLPGRQPRRGGAHQLSVLQSQIDSWGEISRWCIGDIAVRLQLAVNMARFEGHVPQIGQMFTGELASHGTASSNSQRDRDKVAEHQNMAGPFTYDGRRYGGCCGCGSCSRRGKLRHHEAKDALA